LQITDRIGLPHQNYFSEQLYSKLKIKTVLDMGAGQNPQKVICGQLGVRQLLIDSFYPESFNANLSSRQMDFMDFFKVEEVVKNFCDGTKIDAAVSIGSLA
jgi:hypothetical protein